MSSLQFSLFLASTNNQRATFCDWQPITLNPNDTKVLATATSACQQQCTLTSFNSKVSKDDPITNCHKVYSQYRQIIALPENRSISYFCRSAGERCLAGACRRCRRWQPNKRKMLCLSRNMRHHCLYHVCCRCRGNVSHRKGSRNMISQVPCPSCELGWGTWQEYYAKQG